MSTKLSGGGQALVTEGGGIIPKPRHQDAKVRRLER